MLALARLYDRDQQLGALDRAAQARGRARRPRPSAAPRPVDRDRAREERRGDRDAALAALERVAEAEPRQHRRRCASRRASTARPGITTRRSRSCAPSSPTDPPIARRMQLLSEQAQLLTALDREPEAVVAAYLDVLSDRARSDRGARRDRRRRRARSGCGTSSHARSAARRRPRATSRCSPRRSTKIAEWSELAEVRRRQLEAATTPADKAQRAERARASSTSTSSATSMPRSACSSLAQAAAPDEAAPEGAAAPAARGASAGPRWPRCSSASCRVQPDARSARSTSCSSSASCAPTSSTATAEAAQAYEARARARSEESDRARARSRSSTSSSAAIASSPGCSRRAPRRRPSPPRAAALLARVAALRANRGDVDGAIAAYTAAFAADPDEPRRVHGDGARLLQGRALGGGDAALRDRDRARRGRRQPRVPARRSLRATRQRPAQLPRPASTPRSRRTRR